MGRINTGGAKKRTGDNIALASSVSGTTLKLNPPKGYYDGVTGTVNITDADFVDTKISEGTVLFGKTGTLKPIPTVSVSTNCVALSESVVTNATTTNTKSKEIQLKFGGNIRVYFELLNSGTSGNAEARVYKNGVDISGAIIQALSAGVYQVKTYDTSIVYDDVIAVYIRGSNSSAIANIKNCRILIDNSFSQILL